ncbi:MAG: N-acetylneuraminate synthase [Phycisphaerales bacterium]|nr:MAG: N-acetylneuraminate synthase [Phycisphaerales bacterium]
MTKPIHIGNREIGSESPCFIIAEAGVNHNGDLALARQLVDAAVAAGADAVKFQTWVTEKLVTPDVRLAEYQEHNLAYDATQFAMLKELELSYDQFRVLKGYADQRHIVFLSTPNEEDSVDFLSDLGVPAFKIGSGEVTNLPFLRHVGAKNIPVILSTGMATLDEVAEAVQTLEATSNRRLVLLQCVSSYPADPADCNLRAMATLGETFGYHVGFSDHTMGIEIAIAAVARGAHVLEKHLTLDRSMSGPDHRASLEPAEFGEMVWAIRNVEASLGDGAKRPTADELQTRQVVRKCIVTTRTIKAGNVLTAEDVALRRACGGLSAAELPHIVGRRSVVDLRANCTITMDMLQ